MMPSALFCPKCLTIAVAITLATAMTVPAAAQTSGLRPFPLKNNTAKKRSVKISVSYQFFLEGNTSTMKEQASLADTGRKHLYQLLAKECDVLLDTIATTCAIERANVNSQLRQARRRLQQGVRISGSATYRINLRENKPNSERDN